MRPGYTHLITFNHGITDTAHSALLTSSKAAIDEPVLSAAFDTLVDAELSAEGFSFHTSVVPVYSGKIEGTDIELDSYIKHKRFGVKFQPDYTRKVDDLYATYQFIKGAPFDRITLMAVQYPHRANSGLRTRMSRPATGA